MPNTQMPLVSVIIPFYDHADWLQEALESVKNQTYGNLEVLIINDGSKENIDDIIALYRNDSRFIFHYKENGGPASARNCGIELSNGEYITFLDSDDLYEPKKIEKQVKYMIENKSQWSYTSYKTFSDNDSYTGKVIDTPNFRGDVFPVCLYYFPVGTLCIMVRADILKNDPNRRFNLSMRYGQDFYLWVLLSINYEIDYVPNSISFVRIRGGNAAKRAFVQLSVKAVIWKIYKKQAKEKSIPFRAKVGFALCVIFFKILILINRFIKSIKILEVISKCFYVIPYLLFKSVKIKDCE